MLLWTFVFLILPTLFFGGLIAFFYREDPDPPTELPFLLIGCCSPFTAIIGFVLTMNGRLPGTKRHPKPEIVPPIEG